MDNGRDVLVLSGTRTPIGKFGGALAAVPPCDLAATVVREAVSRAGVGPAEVGHAVFGNVIHTEVRDMYLGRVAAVTGGLGVQTPAFTLNRLCGSGLQAIVSAAQAIQLGDCDVAVAGGAESMSRGQYWAPGLRWGQRMGDGAVIDAMIGSLTDPFDDCHMGITAENVAEDFGVSRADQDALAAESHRRAAAATDAGYFKEQITPVEVHGKKGTVAVDTDEHIRPGVTTGDLAKLKPSFTKDGTVTAGNAAGINDLGDQGAVRAAPGRRQVRAGHDVHRWRPGHCRDLRKGLSTPARADHARPPPARATTGAGGPRPARGPCGATTDERQEAAHECAGSGTAHRGRRE